MNDAIALYDDKRWSQRNKTIKYNNLLYHKIMNLKKMVQT
ncbi:hypothetical protein EJK55_0164 [Moraxella catarrhalis]|uniref:Uncharacterized protein n=1 Tax=Moraxella catarrhalis TaxID=480 RepID=A0A3S9QDH4_MORCA|nr:hypothetical protein MCR_0460 [Moraxella catarrhalis BBH18]AZQ92715.1 hypothetical protein EJK53_0485 [Moraxella catarrhalis]AZQ95373.1 hypothetical protein EJK48_0489 [Moraxella catarrhalis]RUO13342.1 hypothetical protein EJK54_0104 [Moraxella catarrhalis]RUO14549.1 hypothetical protein EJK49_1691 [Moraxella catarrhalis]